MDIISQNKKKENTSPPFYICNTTGKYLLLLFRIDIIFLKLNQQEKS